MSKHPVGATWKGIEKETGKVGYIWLTSRFHGYEVWGWSVEYPDGTRPRTWEGGDWGTSYRMCKEDMLLDCRMKRIK